MARHPPHICAAARQRLLARLHRLERLFELDAPDIIIEGELALIETGILMYRAAHDHTPERFPPVPEPVPPTPEQAADFELGEAINAAADLATREWAGLSQADWDVLELDRKNELSYEWIHRKKVGVN